MNKEFPLLKYFPKLEIAAAVLRLYEGGPAILSQRHRFPRTSLTGPGTTGLKLVLNNNIRLSGESLNGPESLNCDGSSFIAPHFDNFLVYF